MADHDDNASVQTPSPITIPHILNTLSYISPPSSLSSIPPHLLSKPLRQRHHFLSISQDDPKRYLIWPSAHPDTVLALLESINPNDFSDLLSAHGTDPVHPDIHYAADPETVYAHVRITPTAVPLSSHPDTKTSLRLIFLWDQASCSWSYHNSATGSFPKNSHSDLSHAMALFQSPDDFLSERTYTFSADNLEDEGDAYWDAYNPVGSDFASSGGPVKPPVSADTEDAYWAQYSSVQGSADSTIPSPRPLNKNLPHSELSEADQRVFVSSSELNPDLPHPELYNPLVPPSPNSLTRRLAALPDRPGSPPLQDDEPPSASASASSPSPQSPHAELAEDPVVVLDPTSQPAPAHIDAVAADQALKCTIRGLYHLWNATASRSQQEFLILVQQAIEEQ